MAALDSLAELNSILEEWNSENAAAGFATSNPVPKITRLAELVEKETEAYYKMDPDPFDDRHPGRANPTCTLGHLFKALFKNEEFMNRVVCEYLLDPHGNTELTIEGARLLCACNMALDKKDTFIDTLVSSYVLHPQRDLNIQTWACRLLYDVLPGLETSVVFQDTEGLVEQLFKWAETGDEPIRSFATGLLAGAMDLTDVASNFKEKNSALVPVMLDRLHALQKEMHEEYKKSEACKEDENKRHFSMFGSHSVTSTSSPMKGTGSQSMTSTSTPIKGAGSQSMTSTSSPNKEAVFKSPSRCEKSVSPGASVSKTSSRSEKVAPSSEKLNTADTCTVASKAKSDTMVANVNKSNVNIPDSFASKTKASDTSEINSVDTTKELGKKPQEHNECLNETVKSVSDQTVSDSGKNVRTSDSQIPCTSTDNPGSVNGGVDKTGSVQTMEADADSEDEVKKEDVTVEDRKARLKRTLSPSFYSDDVYRLKKPRTGNDSFHMSDVSNSSWAEIQPYVIGSYKLEPLTLGMKQRLILQYLTPMGEYQELIHAAFEHNAMDLIFYYINLKYNRDVRLAFEALKYLSVLVCHKKFAIEFLNRSGVQKMLDVYRPSIAATGVSLCFYYLSYFEDAMERVCLVSDHLLTTLVNYMLWLLECSHDSSRCHAAMFFTQSFPFTVILNRFDAHDGLRRLYNVMSTLEILNVERDTSTNGSNEDQPGFSRRQGTATNLNDDQVFTMRQSARHVCVALRKYFEAHLIHKVNELKRSHARNEGGSPHHETPGYKAMKITPELVQENIELMMELMPVRQHWQPEATFYKLGGITLLLQIVGMSQEWSNYTGKPETIKAALDVIGLCCVTPKSQLQLLTSIQLPENHQTPAISILIGLAEGDIYPDPEVQKSALSVIINCVCGPLERLGGGVGRYMGSYSKKKINWRLGEDILGKMWNGVRENNGIMALLKLLTIKAPITDADCIRALACKALVGMARSETVRQIISKLPLFTNGQLQSLMKEPVLQDKRREHVKFCRYATELIERVSGKQTHRYSDATLEDLRKADIVAQSKIIYNGKELIQLIYDHLQKVGYHEAADVLLKESSLPRCTTPPPSHLLHVIPPAHGTSASLYSPTHSTLINPRPLNRQLSLTDPSTNPPTISTALSNLPTTHLNQTLSPQSAFTTKSPVVHSGASGTSQYGSQSSLSPLSASAARIASGHTAQPSSAQHNIITPQSANTPANASSSNTPVAPIRFTIGRQAHSSQSTPTSAITHRNAHPRFKYQKERESALFSPAVRKGFMQKSQVDYEMSLDKIVTEYLRKQHALCRNPVVTCPPMSLFQPHQCPEPRGNTCAPLSFTSRTYRKMIKPKYGGFDGCKLDRKFIYSRFKPMRTFKETEDDGFSCCTFASTQQYLMLGTYGGNLKLVNAQTTEETGSFHCHSSPITHCEHSRNGKVVLTATTYGISYGSALWSWGSETLDNTYNFEDHYLEFSRQVQDRIIGTKEETANIYDITTGDRLLKLFDADKANNYKANRAIFNPTDDLVLNDGVLWDVRSGKSIHKFDKFNQYVSGVFHPVGLEIIINSEVKTKFVWVKGLQGVPSSVMWPVKVLGTKDKELDIFIKSDNAEDENAKRKLLNTVLTQISSDLFSNRVQSYSAVLLKKKRTSTLKFLRNDIDWVCDELKMTNTDPKEKKRKVELVPEQTQNSNTKTRRFGSKLPSKTVDNVAELKMGRFIQSSDTEDSECIAETGETDKVELVPNQTQNKTRRFGLKFPSETVDNVAEKKMGGFIQSSDTEDSECIAETEKTDKVELVPDQTQNKTGWFGSKLPSETVDNVAELKMGRFIQSSDTEESECIAETGETDKVELVPNQTQNKTGWFGSKLPSETVDNVAELKMGRFIQSSDTEDSECIAETGETDKVELVHDQTQNKTGCFGSKLPSETVDNVAEEKMGGFIQSNDTEDSECIAETEKTDKVEMVPDQTQNKTGCFGSKLPSETVDNVAELKMGRFIQSSDTEDSECIAETGETDKVELVHDQTQNKTGCFGSKLPSETVDNVAEEKMGGFIQSSDTEDSECIAETEKTDNVELVPDQTQNKTGCFGSKLPSETVDNVAELKMGRFIQSSDTEDSECIAETGETDKVELVPDQTQNKTGWFRSKLPSETVDNVAEEKMGGFIQSSDTEDSECIPETGETDKVELVPDQTQNKTRRFGLKFPQSNDSEDSEYIPETEGETCDDDYFPDQKNNKNKTRRFGLKFPSETVDNVAEKKMGRFIQSSDSEDSECITETEKTDKVELVPDQTQNKTGWFGSKLPSETVDNVAEEKMGRFIQSSDTEDSECIAETGETDKVELVPDETQNKTRRFGLKFPQSNDSEDSEYIPETEGETSDDDYFPDQKNNKNKTRRFGLKFPQSNDSEDSEYIPETEGETSDDDYFPDKKNKNKTWLIRSVGKISPVQTADDVAEERTSQFSQISDSDVNLEDFVEGVAAELKKRKCSDDSGRPDDRGLKETEKIRDKNTPGIFIKEYVKSNHGKGNKTKKEERPYDTVHACKYCCQLKTHIQDHVKKHSKESDVAMIIKLQAELKINKGNVVLKKKIKQLQDILRSEGDNIHNEKVVKCQEGELLIMRKSTGNDFDHKQFGPCPNCLLWINTNSSVSQHQKNCPRLDADGRREKKGILRMQVKALLEEVPECASTVLKTKVFGIMRSDPVTAVAQNDALITQLGDVWLVKSGDNKLIRFRTSSFHMRLAARLLTEAQNKLKNPILTMTDLIKPTNFDAVADVTLTLCQPEEGDDLKHPSVALKVGYDLTRLAGLKYACCIKKGNDLGKSEAADFLQLLKLQWSTKVSKTAHSIIKERHFDNKRKLPHPKDVQTIAEKLQAAVKDFDFTDSTLYSSVVKTILPRVMVYNRRRSGEIQALTLSRYHARTTKVDDVEESLLGTLSTLEQYLLDQQELIWIRGKRGKRVPVLVPPDCSSALQYLARQDVRKHGGVRPDNQYLFANTGHGVFSAWKCLKDLTEEHTAELIHPDRLCSTGYRAYMATVVQLMGLKDHQLQWICNHLGHTEAIHKTHYRHTLEGVERIQLGKLLLLQDKNLISKFQSKGLEDIQFEDIVTQIDEARSTIENTTSTPANESLEEDCFGDDARETVDLDEVSCDIGEVGTSVKKPVKRVRWTDDEVDEIKRYAAKFLDQGKTPSRQQCASFVKQSIIAKGVLHRRSPDLIMKKISAMNIKARK